MSRDSYDLLGLSGWEWVVGGQTFTGRSRGFMVLEAGDFDATCQTPKQSTSTFSAVPLTPGIFIGGTITLLVVSPGGGSALVFPMDSTYSIT